MGASGWHYFVPFDTDVSRALAALRQSVFQRGDYYWRSIRERPATIEALLRRCGEDGTHSVIDVDRVVERAFAPSVRQWGKGGGLPPTPAEIQERVQAHVAIIGAVGPVPETWLTENCGTTRPDRSMLEQNLFELFDLCPRGAGVWTTVYDAAGVPSELLFAGVTGD